MMLRCAAVRHGRRTMAMTALPRSASRRESTLPPTENADDEGLSGTESLWTPPAESTEPMEPGSLDSFVVTTKMGPTRMPIPLEKRRRQKEAQADIVTLAAGLVRGQEAASWTRLRKVGNEELTPAQQYAEFRRFRGKTRGLGSHVAKHYMPSDLIKRPPAVEDVTLELLMASQTHMGHHTSLWNPSNSRYIYGVRQGIHIISLETTAAHLRRAARVVEEVSYRGGVILFVGTREGHMELVVRAAELAGACYLFTQWTPGCITNRDAILMGHKVRVVDPLDKELGDFHNYMDKGRPLVPSLVVCLNPLENHTMLYECGLKNVPTIGVIDTNADPSWVTYTIPANDDSLRAMAVVAGVLGRAGQRGRERRLEEAAEGGVTWSTPPEIVRHIVKGVKAATLKRKEVMGKIQSNIEGFTEEERALLLERLGDGPRRDGEIDMLELLGRGGDGAAAAPFAASPFAASTRAAALAAAAKEGDAGAGLAKGRGDGAREEAPRQADTEAKQQDEPGRRQ